METSINTGIKQQIQGTDKDKAMRGNREQNSKMETNIATLRQGRDETENRSSSNRPKRIMEKYLESIRYSTKEWPPKFAWHLVKRADAIIKSTELTTAQTVAGLLGYQITRTTDLTPYQNRKNKLKTSLNGQTYRLTPKVTN
jgi:hypothetical protein